MLAFFSSTVFYAFLRKQYCNFVACYIYLSRKQNVMVSKEAHLETPNIGFLLKQINDKMKQVVDAELQPFGLTSTQAHFLHFLRCHNDEVVSQKDFEDYFEISHPTVTGVLRRLEQKELVRIETDPDDRRRNLVFLGPAEAALHGQVIESKKKIDHCLIRSLTPAEQERLQSMLILLNDDLSNYMK